VSLFLFALFASSCGAPADRLGPFARWEKIEISFPGPDSVGLGEPNPFTLPFDVVFTGPDDRSYTVPGFYDGDGRGGLDGNVWKVRFSADRNGIWTYQTQSPDSRLDAKTGQFEVTDPPSQAPEFYRKGRLEYVDQPYLKFREGGYWLKAGADEPENLLGKAFGLDDWASKKRQIDYLAETGINSIYVMTHTLDGDENDVWPWIGQSPEEAKKRSDRYDVAKLERWREFFEYLQGKGIVIQLVLEDDSAWAGYDHARYYREIIARFGYLPAIYFNFGEEHNENYSLEDAIRYMKLLGDIDPYDHPRAIHNVRVPTAEYIDSAELQLTSIQTDPKSPAALNQLAVDWREACRKRNKRSLVVSFDEARPADDRKSWWSVYMGGGIWESLVYVPKGYLAVEPAWKQLAAAKSFMETLPFERMFPTNHLVTKGNAFCLALHGEVYALYLPAGGTVEVDLAAGEDNRYRAEWFDPRSGEFQPEADSRTVTGGRQQFQSPDRQDWALRIMRAG
jgi:hypothetical protein